MGDAHRGTVASITTDPGHPVDRTAARHRAAVLVFVAVLTCAAWVCVLAAIDQETATFPAALLAFVGLAAIVDLKEVRLPLVGIVTLSFVPVLASLMVFGLWPALIVATVSGVSAVRLTRDLWKVLFNVANCIVSTFVGGSLYLTLLPAHPSFSDQVLPAFAYTALDFLLTTALLSVVIGFETGENGFRVWTSNYRWAWLGYLAGASIGVFMAFLYEQLGLAGLAVGLPPLYLIYHSYEIYVARVREREFHTAEVAGFREELMQSAQLHEQLRSTQARVAAEIERARRIQQDLLPARAPEVDGIEIAHRIAFLGEMGGDYYDFVVCPDGRLAVVCGDVMGKGLGAALLMAMARSVLHGAVEGNDDPGRVLGQVNDALARDLADQHLTYFLTLAFLLYDPRGRRLQFAGGGHTPVLLARADDVVQLASAGPLLGVRGGLTFPAESLTAAPGDLLVFSTDGITEARNPAGEQFGTGRLAEAVRRCRGEELPAILDGLWEAVDDFRAGADVTDDATIVLARLT